MRLIVYPATLLICTWTTLLGAQEAIEPQHELYEVMINGESFVIRKDRATTVQSTKNPAIKYKIAIRVAPTQQKELNTVEFGYDWLFTVYDNHNPKLRRVRLVHQLGFTMMITDLGGAIPPDKQVQATTDLVNGVVAVCKDMKGVRVEDRHKLDLHNGVLRGAVVRYVEKKAGAKKKADVGKKTGEKKGGEEGTAHSMLVQTICGKQFAVTCITHYLDEDFEDIKGLIKRTVESFRPLPPAPSTAKRRPPPKTH